MKPIQSLDSGAHILDPDAGYALVRRLDFQYLSAGGLADWIEEFCLYYFSRCLPYDPKTD